MSTKNCMVEKIEKIVNVQMLGFFRLRRKTINVLTIIALKKKTFFVRTQNGQKRVKTYFKL